MDTPAREMDCARINLMNSWFEVKTRAKNSEKNT